MFIVLLYFYDASVNMISRFTTKYNYYCYYYGYYCYIFFIQYSPIVRSLNVDRDKYNGPRLRMFCCAKAVSPKIVRAAAGNPLIGGKCENNWQ